MLYIYDGLNTKIRAMRGRMLGRGDLEALCSLKSVDEVGKRLQSLPGYEDALSETDKGGFHRNVLERKLVLALSEDFSRIYKFITDIKLRKFLSGFHLNMEISIIKLLLCMIYDERDIVYTLPELSLLINKKIKVNIESLMKAKTIPDFVEALEGTPYYGVLSGLSASHAGPGPRSGGESALFDMETQLDLYYYMHLWSLLDESLDRRNRKIMRDILGTEIDLRNITWIYRIKNSYAVELARLYSCLIPIRYKLAPEDISGMAEAADTRELMERIGKTPYGKAFENFKSIDAVFYEQMSKAYSEAASMYPRSLAKAVGYIFDKQLEISNLTTAMECVRYGLGREEALEYLHLY